MRLPGVPIAPYSRGRKSITAGAAWADHLPATFEACGARLPAAGMRFLEYKVANLGDATVLVFEGNSTVRTAVGVAGGTVGGVPVAPGEVVTVSLNGDDVTTLAVKSTGADSAIELLAGFSEPVS